MARPRTVDQYREDFKAAPLGRWSSSFDFGPFPVDIWEFYADGTGKIFDSRDNVMLFEWQEESERCIKFRVTDWGEAFGFQEEEDDEPIDWGQLEYDFKAIESYGPTVVMFTVPENNTWKFWMTMDYLRYEGDIKT